MADQYTLDWSDLAFGSKKAVRSLKATFIVAPRYLSAARITELVKKYLPSGNIVLGISKESHVDGFAEQPQFRMLTQPAVQPLVDKVNAAKLPAKVYVLQYSQRELPFVLEKLTFKHVVLVNGSWKHSFHTLPAFYELTKQRVIPEFVSPFCNQAEAVAYARQTEKEIAKHLILPIPSKKVYSELDMVQIAAKSAQQSFDYSFQTGAAIGKKAKGGYTLLQTSFNQVVPYSTFAMHHGASREQYLSPPNDLNHYDTVHAEVQGIITALAAGQSLKGTSMFVNLLPCPVCSRVLLLSGITEIVYQHDHSDGYAVRMLEQANITVRRLVV